MKTSLFKLTAAALFLALLAPAYAAKADRKKPAADNAANAAILKKFDTNANGKIDGDEAAALRKAFADGKDQTLKALDKDGDAKLSDEEIAAVAAAPVKVKKKKR